MLVDVVVPRVGEAAATITITQWFKQTGDRVEEGEPLFEIDTDKVLISVEAADSGELVEVLLEAGSEVRPLAVAARMKCADDGRAVVSSDREARTAASVGGEKGTALAASASAGTVGSTAEGSEKPVRSKRASPKARRMAEELGVDLAGVAGTGPGGMISAADVERASSGAETNTGASAPGGEPLSRMRQAIAQRMTRSKSTIPHFYVSRDVEMTQVEAVRSYIKSKTGTSPTYTSLFVKACATAMAEFPELNVNLLDGMLQRRRTVDVGIAVAVTSLGGAGPSGLVVPVVREADRKALRDLDREIRELVGRARDNSLRSGDLESSGHSLVLSNLGTYGVDTFIPIIDPPDPMMVAVGAVKARPWVEGGQLVVRSAVTMTIAADHRVTDGASVALYLDRVRELLEHPYTLGETHA